MPGNATLTELLQEVERHLTTTGVSPGAFDAHALLVDGAEAASDEQLLVRAIELAESLEAVCSPEDACLIRYNRANAWAALQQLRRTPENLHAWSQPELLQQIFWLRSAMLHAGFQGLPKSRKAQIHCNLGNALSATGQTVAALASWRRALVEQPILAMARGNLGIGFATYARAVYDEGHFYWLMRRAQEELTMAVSIGLGRDGSTYQEALTAFEGWLGFVESQLALFDEGDPEKFKGFPLGRSKKEKLYRLWCLQKRLFLNPMNDVTTESVAANDALMLPTHRALPVGVTCLAFYNQLKQEFAYARWCLFDGVHARGVHCSDREVKLAFNADFAMYSVGLEQVKTAFRTAYSLLDKIAFFVNDYWQLGVPTTKVDFRTVWTEPPRKGAPSQVRSSLEGSQNFYLQALYWLSLDIYSKDLHQVAQPEAKALNDLRNHLEHKFVKVVLKKMSVSRPPPFADRLAVEIEREDLVAKSEQLLQVCRAALMYVCFAMKISERRATKHDIQLPLEVGDYPDSMKS